MSSTRTYFQPLTRLSGSLTKKKKVICTRTHSEPKLTSLAWLCQLDFGCQTSVVTVFQYFPTLPQSFFHLFLIYSLLICEYTSSFLVVFSHLVGNWPRGEQTCNPGIIYRNNKHNQVNGWYLNCWLLPSAEGKPAKYPGYMKLIGGKYSATYYEYIYMYIYVYGLVRA